MTEQTRPPRLTGRHIVLIVVALCAAVVLTPVSVQAAGIAKFQLVDANSTRAAEVSRAGRLQSDVAGTVSARYAVPAQAFSVYWGNGQTLQQAVGATGRVYITSITVSNLSTGALSAYVYRWASDCTTYNGYFYYARVPANDTVVSTFPTPLIVTQPCARPELVYGQLTMIITGYRA